MWKAAKEIFEMTLFGIFFLLGTMAIVVWVWMVIKHYFFS